MTAAMDRARAVIAEALRGEGLSDRPDLYDSSIHSWRCEHPDRYGRCTCFKEAVDAILAALVERMGLREDYREVIPDALRVEQVRLVTDWQEGEA